MNNQEFNKPFTLFDRKTTLLIKIIALILMVSHHTWGFTQVILEPIPLLDVEFFGWRIAEIIQSVTKPCVTIFAFLTGYFYAYNKNPSFKYSAMKIWELLKSYWYFLFLILLPIAYFFGHPMTLGDVLLQLFAINPDKTLMTYTWYVYFFIISMLLIPWLSKKFTGTWKQDLFLLFLYHIIHVVLFLILTVITTRFTFEVVRNVYSFFPILLIGYYFARHNVFQTLYDTFKLHNAIIHTLIAISLLLIRGFSLFYQPLWALFDIILTPFIVYSLILAVQPLKASVLYSKLAFLDKHIVNIWFNHCLFAFVYTAPYIQKIMYFPTFPPFVIVWLIILCLPLSLYVNKVDEILTKQIEKIRKD